MVTTGAYPATLWGASGMGVAPAQLSAIRSAMATTLGIRGRSRCKTVTIALRMGVAKDPAVRVPLDVLRDYLNFLRTATERELQELRDMWPGMVARHSLPRWDRVAGPIAAAFCTLARFGWRLVSPALARTAP